MDRDKFCLHWNDYETNMKIAFNELRIGNNFFDITLVCEDEQIQAHKVILSACSPFFRKILLRNPHHHPLVYLKGVKCSVLQSVLNFMYNGEVSVVQEELNSFLAVAKDLEVKGLIENQSIFPNSTKNLGSNKKTTNKCKTKELFNESPPLVNQTCEPSNTILNTAEQHVEVQGELAVKTEPIETSHPATPFVSTDVGEQASTLKMEEEHRQDQMQQCGEGIQSGTERILVTDEEEFENNLKENAGQLDGKTWTCFLCGKITNRLSNMRQHMEAYHFSLGEINCSMCDKVFKNRHSMATHVSNIHRNRENIF